MRPSHTPIVPHLTGGVNQRLAPSDPSFNVMQDSVSGKFFADLDGTYDLASPGDLTVVLSDTGIDGYIIADAIRIELITDE